MLYTLTRPNEVFVFGSNLAGRHGKGAALTARMQYGASYGVGIGLSGRSYAIPTKDHNLRTLDIHQIKQYVDDFVVFAKSRPDLKFYITAIGCGLAGYRHEQIAPLFAGVPENCVLPNEWSNV